MLPRRASFGGGSTIGKNAGWAAFSGAGGNQSPSNLVGNQWITNQDQYAQMDAAFRAAMQAMMNSPLAKNMSGVPWGADPGAQTVMMGIMEGQAVGAYGKALQAAKDAGKPYNTNFQQFWNAWLTNTDNFTTAGKYFATLPPGQQSGQVPLGSVQTGTDKVSGNPTFGPDPNAKHSADGTLYYGGTDPATGSASNTQTGGGGPAKGIGGGSSTTVKGAEQTPGGGGGTGGTGTGTTTPDPALAQLQAAYNKYFSDFGGPVPPTFQQWVQNFIGPQGPAGQPNPLVNADGSPNYAAILKEVQQTGMTPGGTGGGSTPGGGGSPYNYVDPAIAQLQALYNKQYTTGGPTFQAWLNNFMGPQGPKGQPNPLMNPDGSPNYAAILKEMQQTPPRAGKSVGTGPAVGTPTPGSRVPPPPPPNPLTTPPPATIASPTAYTPGAPAGLAVPWITAQQREQIAENFGWDPITNSWRPVPGMTSPTAAPATTTPASNPLAAPPASSGTSDAYGKYWSAAAMAQARQAGVDPNVFWSVLNQISQSWGGIQQQASGMTSSAQNMNLPNMSYVLRALVAGIDPAKVVQAYTNDLLAHNGLSIMTMTDNHDVGQRVANQLTTTPQDWAQNQAAMDAQAKEVAASGKAYLDAQGVYHPATSGSGQPPTNVPPASGPPTMNPPKAVGGTGATQTPGRPAAGGGTPPPAGAPAAAAPPATGGQDNQTNPLAAPPAPAPPAGGPTAGPAPKPTAQQQNPLQYPPTPTNPTNQQIDLTKQTGINRVVRAA